ncbi:MAG: HlyC/CorC family transporter [Nitriliruptoraceae bacterium]|nr:HlyC/CorC family transporter [Nitriliruptoraceae bacterium]
MSPTIGALSVVFLVLVGAIFVAAEFALASLRDDPVRERAARGSRAARLVTHELDRAPVALGVAQLGITVSSVVLGALAVRALGAPALAPQLAALGLGERWTSALAIGIALALAAVLHLVVAELFARNLAVARPLAVALTLAPVMRVVVTCAGPLVRPLDALARWIARGGGEVSDAASASGGHDLDDLARIIAASGEQGSLTPEQRTLLLRAVELGDRRASEIMIPRPDVAFLPRDASLEDLRIAARTTGHSRFPVQGATEDDVVGSIHIKDLLAVPVAEHATTPVASLARPMLAVPESEPLRALLTDLRREQRTSALVVDEYGATAGIVTVEDVLEELVGDITDEFDRADRLVRRIGAGQHLLGGGLRLDRAQEVLGVELPEGPYETIAGFVLERLGRIAQGGETVSYGPVDLTVTAVDDMRITELRVRRSRAGSEGSEGSLPGGTDATAAGDGGPPPAPDTDGPRRGHA